jgi:glycosyltransferase involved in cell wall biosynthesis
MALGVNTDTLPASTISGRLEHHNDLHVMNHSEFRLMQIMLSSQNGGAETFFDKLCLALADDGVRQYAVIEPHPRREQLLAAHPLIDVAVIRFRGLRELVGRFAIRRYARRVKPSLMLAWMDRAVKRVPRGICPVVARLGGYYGLDRYRYCDRLIGNTPDLVQYFLRNGIPQDRVECIPNFGEIAPGSVPVEEARQRLRAEWGIPETHALLLALGRLHPSKGHDILIRAVESIPDVSVVIAGEGALRAELHALANRLGVADRVHLIGWRTDTADLFAAADISVFPSRVEPFGNVIVESWAQRVPLIAARSVGPAWLVSHEVDGLLCAIDDVKDLQQQIVAMLGSAELRHRCVAAGYAKFQDQFSRKSIVHRYRTMFADVLARRAPTPNMSQGAPSPNSASS